MTWILPKLGHCEVAALTFRFAPGSRGWRRMVGTKSKSAVVVLRQIATSASSKQHSNHAFDEGRISSNAAWGRRLKKYRGVASTRARYLTIPEARRFLNACDPVFKPLARAALETGCRYSELARLEVWTLTR